MEVERASESPDRTASYYYGHGSIVELRLRTVQTETELAPFEFRHEPQYNELNREKARRVKA